MAPDGQLAVDAQRVQEAYTKRAEEQVDRVYDPMTLAGAWGHLEVERHLLWALGRTANDLETLQTREVLEVGCGNGGHLLRLVALGMPPNRLHGIDLLEERIATGRAMHPELDLRVGNGAELPWPNASVDLVTQFTCLSSVLDGDVRLAIAREMRRVLNPGGAILSFDFVWNPTNRDTLGIGLKELHRLFPGAKILSRRVFLAPPLARRLTWCRPLLLLLDMIPFLCFHRIAVIKWPKGAR